MEISTLADVLGNERLCPLGREISQLYHATSVAQDQWSMSQSTDAARLWLLFNYQQAVHLEQGWKLHISAYPSSAIDVLQRVLELLLKSTSSFKVIASLQALRNLNQGLYGWSQIGKFITIYPASEQEAVTLATLLDQQTRSLSAPKVPSDRALHPGSLIHYRYGSFRANLFLQERDGLISPAIRTPTSALQADRRKNHYEAPTWCVDPFVKAGIASELPRMQRMLDKRYLLARIIAASPTHTLYIAGDLQQARSCVIKGPCITWAPGPTDESINQGLLHEANILKVLSTVQHIPTLYEYLEQDGCIFLVLEDIQGETLAHYAKRVRDQSAHIGWDKAIDWGKQIVTILQAIHEQGLVYADLKPSNVMIDKDEHLYLIDFELTDRRGSQYTQEYGTRGYISPQRQLGLPLEISDDIYSFGALLYFVVTAAEPSEAPDATALLTRAPGWFSSAGASLQHLISRCLSTSLDERYTSMQEILEALNSLEFHGPHMPISFGGGDDACEDIPGEKAKWEQLSQELLQTLCAVAQRAPEQPGVFWSSAHTVSYGIVSRDINTGNAGTLLALAELVSAHPAKAQQTLLTEAAHWMQHAAFIDGQPLPGLYIGEAGVGAALLRAGQILHDDALIIEAIKRGRLVASLPYASPDLFHGTAGRLRFHLWLWDETGEQQHLQHAIACGEHILATAQRNAQQEICWTLPEGYNALSGQTYLGYAHGAAGIADALLDLFEVTGDERYCDTLQGAARWLKRLCIASDGDEAAWNWPIREHESVTAPFWCHGGAGIGLFFLHAMQSACVPDAGEFAARAATSVARGTRWANSTQCHGLAGSIEFLLDMYQATGQYTYRTQAYSLARCLRTFALEQEGLRVFPSEVPTIFTPDYMIGYSGVAMCLLRLNAPEYRPRQLSRQGFRYKPPG